MEINCPRFNRCCSVISLERSHPAWFPAQLLNTLPNGGYRPTTRGERRNCNDAIWNGFKPFRSRRNEFSRRLRGKFPAGVPAIPRLDGEGKKEEENNLAKRLNSGPSNFSATIAHPPTQWRGDGGGGGGRKGWLRYPLSESRLPLKWSPLFLFLCFR